VHLNKINKPESLALIAYSALRDSILSFKLQQGQLYNEMSVSQELGLSRTPVREALLRLSSESLITFLPRKGFIITSFTQQDIEEIFELRLILESTVVRKITSKGNIDELRRYIKLQHCAAAKNDYHGFMLSDRIFHKFFFELADNFRLLGIMNNFQDICHMMGVCYLKVDGLYEEAIQDHETIVESIETGDANMAEAAISKHITKVKAAVLKTFTADSESVK
jgi:DNA-binding GntR family transcriptional regulator